jgi:DNA-binding HxlR family transcriptional regulator
MQATYHAAAEAEAEGSSTPSPAAVAQACELIGDRWSLAILAALLERALRYTEIQELLPGLAPNILSARLRTLEQEGLLSAERYSARPPRFEYRLTADGRALREALLMLAAWQARRGLAHGHEREPAASVHELCGEPLELCWWCPSCATPASAAEHDGTLHA